MSRHFRNSFRSPLPITVKPRRHRDVHRRRKPVGRVAADGEPARGIKQEGVIVLNRRELDAVDGRFFSCPKGGRRR